MVDDIYLESAKCSLFIGGLSPKFFNYTKNLDPKDISSFIDNYKLTSFWYISTGDISDFKYGRPK